MEKLRELQERLVTARRIDPRAPAVDPSFPVARGLPIALSRREQMELLAILHERAARKREALKLYRPWVVQEAFHASKAKVRLARGSNRGGKTLVTCVELARAVTRRDPHGKYPEKGRIIVVGKDLLHCSKVIFRKLFKPGAFRIIKDAETLEWRVFDPIGDADRVGEAEDAPPLIPQRFYSNKAMSWENKREEICRSVRFETGWELTFFSGEGQPPQGWDVDLILFDEEIPHPGWYPEMVPRLVDRGGRFIWSFTPQAGTTIAYELHGEAIESRRRGDPEPRIEDFLLTIADNPYLSEAAKEEFRSSIAFDEEELRVRYYGDFALKGMRVYPEFQKGGVHRVDALEVPKDWTNYLAMDPGRRVAAALLIAVPPPNGRPPLDRPVVWGEVYSRQSTAAQFAEELRGVVGDHQVRDWLIDHQHGRKHTEESGLPTEDLYAEEFRRVGLERNGFQGFVWANPDPAAGKLAAKARLRLLDGAPAWYFMVDRLPWFVWEIEKYVDRRISKGGYIVDDVSRSNLHNHLMDCFRYLAMHHCRHVAPEHGRPRRNAAVRALERKRAKTYEQAGWGGSIRLA